MDRSPDMHQPEKMPEADPFSIAPAAPPAYVAKTGWPPGMATLAAAAVFALAVSMGSLVALAVVPKLGVGLPPEQGNALLLLISVLVMQAVIVLAMLFIAGFYGSRRAEALAMRAPVGGWRAVAAAFAGLVLIVAIFNVVAKLADPGDIERDLQPFVAIARSDLWWVCLIAVGVGAPLSEELMFRGFLFPAYAQSRLGPAGAGLLTALGWSGLHASYSALGMAEVALIGLYLAFVLWRTGSLWVTILVHGVYNSVLFAIIALAPLPQIAG